MNPVKLSSVVIVVMVLLTGSVTSGSGARYIRQSVSKPSRGTDKLKQNTQLNIGLLIPDKEALEAKHGAEIAIRDANKKGGYPGLPFHLVVRSSEGPWGAGSKKSVGLVFDDNVLAIMGSLDGRNAHLAEQVATKTKVAFISAWATDMTLSYAFVPWYFRCIPDDEQQATALIQEIYNKRRINNIALIGTESYDSRNALNTFIKVAESMGITKPRQFLYKSSDQNFLAGIDESGIEAFVLFGKPALASDFMSLYRQGNMKQPVFGTLSLLDDQKSHTHNWNILDNSIMVSSDQWFTNKGVNFQKQFQRIYGYQPGPVAAYAYDGMNMIIKAIKVAGPDRDKIIDALSKMKYSGITGEIRFDEKGNRSGDAGLMILKNGVPVPIKEDK
ncbi:MAG: ABC transporter substrate-binding protein [Chlorobi bacterium]|nr:ABC transporter substrate-binding protein [Chlorobiota bacterium]